MSYYKVVFLEADNKSTDICFAINPHDYCFLAKMCETSPHLVRAVLALLLPGKRGHMRRVVWASDDANPEPGSDGATLYKLAKPYHTHEKLELLTPAGFRYLVNHDKREFIDVDACSNYSGTAPLLLPLMLAEGHSHTRTRGVPVGCWARDRLSLESTCPSGFSELVFGRRGGDGDADDDDDDDAALAGEDGSSGV